MATLIHSETKRCTNAKLKVSLVDGLTFDGS